MELIEEKETDRLSLISCLEWCSHDHLVVYSCSIRPGGYSVIRVMFKVAANVPNARFSSYQYRTEMQRWRKIVNRLVKIFVQIF